MTDRPNPANQPNFPNDRYRTLSGHSPTTNERLDNTPSGHSTLLNDGRLSAHSGRRENKSNYLSSLTPRFFPISDGSSPRKTKLVFTE